MFSVLLSTYTYILPNHNLYIPKWWINDANIVLQIITCTYTVHVMRQGLGLNQYNRRNYANDTKIRHTFTYSILKYKNTFTCTWFQPWLLELTTKSTVVQGKKQHCSSGYLHVHVSCKGVFDLAYSGTTLQCAEWCRGIVACLQVWRLLLINGAKV